jgi:sialate O-acetylesterase
MRRQLFFLRAFILVTTIFLAAGTLRAEVRLPRVFGSHMVFQQDKPLVVWGWAQPNETVAVELASEKVQATANEKGEWRATLPAMKAGGPYTLTVSGSSTVKFDDIMIGEVWLCSGQSNMEMGMGMIQNSKEEIARATNANIRLLLVKRNFTPVPQTDIDGEWKICSPQTIVEGGWSGFSAAAYFFGRKLQADLGVTIGLIESSWGGTRIEPWTPPVGFAAVPALAHEYEFVKLADPRTEEHHRRLEETLDQIRLWLAEAEKADSNRSVVPAMPVYPAELQPPHELQSATVLYNGMIHPLIPFAIRGAIWYQGESNLGDTAFYTERMKAMIAGWRQLWGEGDFPFYYVQIAPYNYGNKAETEAEFWEAQTAAEKIPNTGMAVINDIGNLKDIHPKNKQEVGRRLALWALAKTYGKDIPVYTGPVFQSMTVDGDKLRLTFDHIGGGLKTRDGKAPDWFEIIDADDGGFVKADAQIDGANILLSAPSVKHPVAMRFAWSMMAEPNLMNAEGFPVSAFRAGSVPKRDLLYRDVPEAKEYQLVYDLDLNKLGRTITYDVDNRGKIQQPFDRIAYFLELQTANGDSEYLYASMDAFTSDLGKIGIPTVNSGAQFQQNVSHLDVYSSAKGIVTGLNLSGGNIEFWPNNYGKANAANVPNASGDVYDFGDQISDPPDGYGSMQVHNHDAKQTLFSVNHWNAGQGADIGIGNRPTDQPDWTFAGNAGEWPVKRLRILVRCK